MTTARRTFVNCFNCNKKNIKCPDCKELLMPDTSFSRWLRNLSFPNNGSRVSNHNLDFIWFRFYDNWFITIEEKINSKEYNRNNKSDLSQIQSHGLVAQMLQYSSGNMFDISFGNWKRIKTVEYRGHYLITFEKTNPDDSKWIKINGSNHNRYELLILLRYGKLITIKSNLNKPQDIFAELSSKIKNISFPDIIKIISSE